MNCINILIIEDHPMICQAYINSISDLEIFNVIPKFTVVTNCQDAYAVINKTDTYNIFDLALVDHRLPPYKEKNVLNGADLALMIKEQIKNCKIIMITAHSEIITVYDILKEVMPNGFMIKNDLTSETLQQGIVNVMEGGSYYSYGVSKIIKEIGKKELMTNSLNRQIILHLSRGYKIRELEPILQLSVSSIKRRIAQMKDVFNVKEECNLVKEAILQGYL